MNMGEGKKGNVRVGGRAVGPELTSPGPFWGIVSNRSRMKLDASAGHRGLEDKKHLLLRECYQSKMLPQ